VVKMLQTQVMPDKILVGYWHNFVNAAGYIKLRDVSNKWDVINVAFAETAGDNCTVQFNPDQQTETDLKADIAYLSGLGKKIVLSIGGQNAAVSLPDGAATQTFINSVIEIIDNYGFQGLDLDIETGISLEAGDTDLNHPITPMIVNLISATNTICEHYGANFILSMAPEIAYVQGGITAYATNWGAYLPIIQGLRDKLTYVHVQHYNCGGNTALDGNNYNQGTTDFEVAMAEMLLHGFPIAGNNGNMFPPLRQDQVMIGLPACSGAAPSGGYITPADMERALNYIMKGISDGGTYKLVNPSGYPDFRGLMAWSVNWDAYSNYEFSTNYRVYFDGLQPPPVVQAPATPTGLTAIVVSESQINLTWNLSASEVSYDLEVDGGVVQGAACPYAHTGLAAGTVHVYRVRAQNQAGQSGWSEYVKVATLPSSQYSRWSAGNYYKTGDVVTYKGKVYKCLQAHTALNGWEPDTALALWKEIG
jgi:chitinase